MTEAERNEIVSLLATAPDHGVRPAGWGGARKFRVARPGGGKSGGYRIVSAYCGGSVPVFLITVFSKGEKDNLTKAEAQQVAALVKQLCDTYAEGGQA